MGHRVRSSEDLGWEVGLEICWFFHPQPCKRTHEVFVAGAHIFIHQIKSHAEKKQKMCHSRRVDALCLSMSLHGPSSISHLQPTIQFLVYHPVNRPIYTKPNPTPHKPRRMNASLSSKHRPRNPQNEEKMGLLS